MGLAPGTDADDAGAGAAQELPEAYTSKRFSLVRRLGSGGMGVVFEVLDRERGEPLALKTLQRMKADDILAFKNEFRFLCGITHRNLVRLGELLRVGERWFFTMELVHGVDFQSYVRIPRPDAASTTAEPPDASPGPPEMIASVAGMPTAATVEIASVDRGSGRAGRALSASATQLDEERLRAGLTQLVDGVCALHDAGIVHRDIKPPNVLVEPGGRVVVLDFGLAAQQRTRRSLRVAGTPQYMAPEQAAGLPPSRAADWYAVGVMLYLALVGQLPFMGDTAYVLKQKRFVDAPAPSDLVPDVPADLDELCVELMRRNPEDRPHGREILRRLGRAQAQPLRRSRIPRRVFVGRRAELRTLHAGFDAAREQPAVMLLSGRSGVGKSALVQQFVRQLSRDTAALILHGRCYERESMPFKAVDEVIDDLTHQLHELPAEQQRALLPPGSDLIAQAFPVFRKLLSPQGDGDGSALGILDPQQRRAELFARLRTLMHALARYRPVVLIIDDLQWADRDSLALLAELTRPPGGPPLMLLCTLHRAEELAAAQQMALQTLFACEVRQLEIEPLRLRAARELALAVLDDLDVEPAHVQTMAAAVARESQGVPFFIELLARHAAAHGPSHVLDLDRVLRSSLAALAPLQQRILAVVCLAGRPLELGVLGRALGCPFSELLQSVDDLRSRALLATSGAASDRLECYHEGVRAAVLAGVGEPDRRGLHHALAQALEQEGVDDDELLAIHWRGAGAWAHAATYAARAAHDAAAAMAFDRASYLYAMVLDLEVPTEARRIELLTHMGQTLALAGRGAEAARAFLELAENVPSPHSQHYRRRALAQLLESGHLEQGLAVLQDLLHEVGIPYPKSKFATKAGLLWRRARLRLRGLAVRAAQPAPSVDHITALETAYAASAGLAMTDTMRSIYFQTHGLALALASGDAYRITRALALEACFIAMGGHRTATRTDDVLARAAAMAQGMNEPHGHAMLALAYGITAFMRGHWLVARMQLEHAAHLLRSRCMGVTWEITTVQRFLCWTLWHLGELREQERILPLYMAEAEARGDIYAMMSFASNLRFLDDDSARERRKTLSLLQQPERGGYLPRHQLFFNLATLDLYEGDGIAAWERLQRVWRWLTSSISMNVEPVRIGYRELRGRAAIAALLDEGGRGRTLRRVVHAEIRALLREAADWAHGYAHLLRAGLLAVDHEPTVALEGYAAAEEVFARADMKLMAYVARDRRGILLGGAEGHALRGEAHRYLDEQAVINPERMLAMLAPGRWPAFRPGGLRALYDGGPGPGGPGPGGAAPRARGLVRTGILRAQLVAE
jgi:eukaryotic-like serine/threonine-protein kinase